VIDLKPLASAAAIMIVIDTLVTIAFQLGLSDWGLFQAFYLVSWISWLLMGVITAAFFIHFASRMKPDVPRASALRFLLIAGAVLFAVAILTRIMSPWLGFTIFQAVSVVQVLVLGALALLLALYAGGFMRFVGALAFVVSLVVAVASAGANVFYIMRESGSPATESIAWLDASISYIYSWSTHAFWLLFAAMIASIAARIRNV
jgi:hypothetical protein